MSPPKSQAGSGYQTLIGALLVSLAWTVLLGMVVVAGDGRSDFAVRLLGTASLASACLGILVTLGAVIRRRPLHAAGVISVMSTAIGAVALAVALWFQDALGWTAEEFLVKTGTTGLIIGGAVAHAAIFRCLVTRSVVLLVARITTVVLTWLFVTLLTTVLWIEDLAEMLLFGSGFAGLMIMILCGLGGLAGTIVVPLAVVSRANRDETASESFEQRVPIEIECPRCRHRQTVRAGAGRCAACRVLLRVEIDEPRCACGYLLYRLVGDSCPECGSPVPDEQRWDEPELVEAGGRGPIEGAGTR